MSIASRITAIEEHIRDVYDTIDYSYDTTGVDKNIINIPQNIFNGYINVLNDNGQSLWNALEKVSQADITEAELSNVVTAPMKIDLKGNTSQEADPTPDTPVEVKVVKGENVVSISGENQSDKTDYPINLGDIELCKINTYKDFPFKAINGNEYYDTLTAEQKNTLNYGSWYVHKAIRKIIFDGSENWGLDTTKQITQVFRLNNSAFKFKEDSVGYCNYFINQAGDTEKFSYIANETYMFFAVNKTRASSIAEFKNWLSSHNTILYYPIATPTETEITNTTLIEQLEAISKAKSVKDKTYITQTNDELPFILDVEAIKEYEVV